MKVLSWDSETRLITNGEQAPPMACMTFKWGRDGTPQIVHVSEVGDLMRAWLADPTVLFVGHNVAYDFGVLVAQFPSLLKLVFAAYRDNRVTDTMIRQRLLDIAAGKAKGSIDAKGIKRSPVYDLETLAKRCAGMYLQKDALRLLYGEFIAYKLDQWPARMRELQAKASGRLAEAIETVNAERNKLPKKSQDKALIKELDKEITGLQAFVESDAERCTKYPLDDAEATAAVYFSQERHFTYLKDQFRQARAYFALGLSSTWGICVDGEGVDNLQATIEREYEEVFEQLNEAGLVKVDKKGKVTRDTKAAKALMVQICREEGLPIVYSEAHFSEEKPCPHGDACVEHICLDAEACERSDDELMIAYAEFGTLTKQLANDIKSLRKGILLPLHPRYFLAETGRTTCSKPNIQNQSNRPGFREAFIARPGFWYMQCDFPTLELYTLAQCCISWFGHSELAKTLLSGKDPHLAVAAKLLKKPYEWCEANLKTDPVVKKTRTLAKLANFGFPGGMGAPKFVASARKQTVMRAKSIEQGRAEWANLDLTVERAKQLKDEWLDALPEMQAYFARVRWLTKDGPANVETLFTERMRGQATYCATANNGFQALGSDCAKNAVWRVTEAQYVLNGHPLYNSRMVAFVHDEIIAEVRAIPEVAHKAAYALGHMMADGANEFLPDVPISHDKMVPVLMKRWNKKAETVFDANGLLTPWDLAMAAKVA